MVHKIVSVILYLALAATATTVYANGGAVRVHNNTSTTVTVNAENGYCCTADAGDECTCVLSLGPHTLTATRHDSDANRVEKVNVPAEGYDFVLTDGNP
ncbi:MAG TPA: hypothetical protein VLV87_09070 [Gammaproteobacteria bacterium]|nr:hypothetical protein [Gammaproteobacteria bacterium]